MEFNKVVVNTNYPMPAGTPSPRIFSDEQKLLLTYSTNDDRNVVIIFPSVSIYKFGAPNDETLPGHPLYSKGLGYNNVFEILNSSWIDETEKINSVHPRHDKEWFLKDKKHLVFSFHDSIFECIIRENESVLSIVLLDQSEGELLNILKQNNLFI